MGKPSRDKGKRGEREAARELRRLFRVEAHRGRQYQGGDDSPDVRAAIPHTRIEVKRTERLRAYDAIAQAAGEAADGEVPLVLARQNGRPWLAIVRLDDLPQLAVTLFHTLAENA